MELAEPSAPGAIHLAWWRTSRTGLASDRLHAARADLEWEPTAARTAEARDDELDRSRDVLHEPSPNDSQHDFAVGEALIYCDYYYMEALQRLLELQAPKTYVVEP